MRGGGADKGDEGEADKGDEGGGQTREMRGGGGGRQGGRGGGGGQTRQTSVSPGSNWWLIQK